jgi:hypothetical protein
MDLYVRDAKMEIPTGNLLIVSALLLDEGGLI